MLSPVPSPSTVASARPHDFPRIFRPFSNAARKNPLAWLNEHLEEVHLALLRSGVVVLRSFAISEPDTFRALIRRVGGPLGTSYHGPSPRQSVAPEVYSASEVPSALVIPEHAEMSYLPHMARHLYFWCREPASSGGQTTFVDGRRLLDHFDAQLTAPLFSSPVRIRRRHAARRLRLDPFELKAWPDMFGTKDRERALAQAHELGFEASFDRRGALTLESEQWLARRHPETGERAFLNHLLVFHASTPAAILTSAFARERKLLALAAQPLAVGYRRLLRRLELEVASDVRYADGTQISDEVVSHVRSVVDRLALPFSWQRGDLAIVDNHIALHGRRPFRGPRSVAVAFSAAFA
jgi:alpha-ketoglutarate-dependent taurine dioxygenase